MFDTLERRYLIGLAEEFKRHGLTSQETENRIHAEVGYFCTANRIRCAVRFVYDPCDVHSAAIF
ncbi:MAG: hypothetical protein ABJQ34_03230 [Paracoccaceae bacterium]